MGRVRVWRCARSSWLAPIMMLLACNSQVQGDYPGEPMATLEGVVASGASLELDSDVSAAIVWKVGAGPEGPRFVGERVAIDTSFPASFTLHLYDPPAAEGEVTTHRDTCVVDDHVEDLESCAGQVVPAGTGIGLWHGYLAAIDANVPDGEIDREDILGIDTEHVILYYDFASDDAAPHNRFLSIGYDEPHGVGYILARLHPGRTAEDRMEHECLWEGICVHWTTHPVHQDYNDWSFERCQERFPDNPTCSAFGEQYSSGEPESSTECRERWKSLRNRELCAHSTLPTFTENPDGLADPITIQLGLDYWDMHYVHPHSW